MYDPVADRLERHFRHLYHQHMINLSTVNRTIEVEATAKRQWQLSALYALVTPWFTGLFAFPESVSAARESLEPGTLELWHFPSGDYCFVAATDAELGEYSSCTLKQDMREFNSHKHAMDYANAVLEMLLGTAIKSTHPATAAAQPIQEEQAGLPRREWLRTLLRHK